MISLRDMLDTDAQEAKAAARALIALYEHVKDDEADAALFALVKWLHVRHPVSKDDEKMNAERLAALGGSQPNLELVPRR